MQAETVVFQTATKPARNPLALMHLDHDSTDNYNLDNCVYTVRTKLLFTKKAESTKADYRNILLERTLQHKDKFCKGNDIGSIQ